MTLEIFPATMQEHDTLLRNLYQFYLYEFTRFVEGYVTAGGRFEESDLDDCWKRGRQIFLAKVGEHYAGFAILDEDTPSRFVEGERVRYMLEFFIMAYFQGKGFGEQFARFCFDRFPGKWEVAELIENVNAQHFWRKIIGRYTGGQYQEKLIHDGRIVLQYFKTP